MANTRSAEKRTRQTEVRTARNRALKSRVRSKRKAFLAAIEAGDAAKAETELRALASVADRAVKSNVIHRHAASRIKSSASKAIAGLKTSA